jgi:hypothetical protein
MAAENPFTASAVHVAEMRAEVRRAASALGNATSAHLGLRIVRDCEEMLTDMNKTLRHLGNLPAELAQDFAALRSEIERLRAACSLYRALRRESPVPVILRRRPGSQIQIPT